VSSYSSQLDQSGFEAHIEVVDSLEKGPEVYQKNVEDEVLMLHMLSGCNNIIRCYGFSHDLIKQQSYILMEIATLGSLTDLSDRHLYPEIPRPVIIYFILGLTNAVTYLHSHNVVHKDIKPQNVLLSQGLTIKLCDFGLSKKLDTGKSKTMSVKGSVQGTTFYMAPEVTTGKHSSRKSDVYSLGMTIIVMCLRRHGYDAVGVALAEELVHVAQYSDIGEIVGTMVGHSPSFRPDVSRVLKSVKELWSAIPELESMQSVNEFEIAVRKQRGLDTYQSSVDNDRTDSSSKSTTHIEVS
jgi:serine/threonine protein kinase